MTVRLCRSTVFSAPIERVWEILRDFNGHESWHPAVAESAIEDGEPADRIGAVRAFRLQDGGRIREQLLSLSDREHSLRYFILESPSPLRDYVAEVRLKAVTSDDACYCEWSATFDPPVADRDRLTRFICDDIIEAGIAALRRTVAGDVTAPTRLPAPATSDAEATAIVVTRYGGPEVMETRPLRVLEPGPGEARLRQTAIGVNFIDVYCRRGSFTLVPPGGVLGMEAAGVVERVGGGVTTLRPGDRVGYACAPPGAYTTLRNMPADMLVRIPPSLTDALAAALLLKGITASFLLHDVHTVKAGDRILVHAAAGGVGLLLGRWAKALGAYVIGVTSSEAKAARAKQAGCDEALTLTGPSLVARVRELTGGQGVDVVYDAVGADTFETSIACLAPRGHLVSFGQASGDVGSRSIDALATGSVTLSRPNYAHYTDDATKLAVQTRRLFAALEDGVVAAEAPRIYPMSDVRQAHSDLEGRATTGSLVLRP